MAKPIQMAETEIDAALARARQQLLAQKSADGKIQVEVNLPTVKKRARVQFSPVAYAKMLTLIHGFATEVAWHGIVTRVRDGLFRISDILVYPQTVTGASVRTDEREYGKWLMEFDDDTFNSLRMQGHSHVNMRVSPSGTDTNDQKIVLDQMGGGCKFYIFMIWNKKLERSIWVYDLEENLLYETEDVDVSIGEKNIDLEAFLAGAKGAVEVSIPEKAATQPFRYQGNPFPGYDDEPPPGYGRGYQGVGVRSKGGKGKHEPG